ASVLVTHCRLAALFSYTTLFRSGRTEHSMAGWNLTSAGSRVPRDRQRRPDRRQEDSMSTRTEAVLGELTSNPPVVGRVCAPRARSEEHTSELQSRFERVCRLLLE